MTKVWNVKVDDVNYSIQAKRSTICVNDVQKKYKECRIKSGMFDAEYEVNIGSKKALLIVSSLVGGTKLIMDGKDCATGEDYVPVKLPKWAMVFMVLHAVNLLNGILGITICLLSCSMTVSISANPKFPTIVKVLLNVVVLVIAYAIVFGLALLTATL